MPVEFPFVRLCVCSFCFHQYIVMFLTHSITGAGLIPAVVSQDNQTAHVYDKQVVKGLAQNQ